MFDPFGSVNQTHTSAWRAEPAFRGTYSIVSSCLMTMVLCVWTAVHLNLPEHNRLHKQKWRKLEWLLMGLFAPEMVAWTAFEQRREARALHRLMREALGQPKPSSFLENALNSIRKVRRKNEISPGSEELEDQTINGMSTSKRYPWTIVHSHFAIMGGFAFDTRTGGENFLPGQRTRVTLSNCGVYALARSVPDLLPNLSEQQIQDKSKANGLAKALVCLQATWFCLQCVSRLALNLSISLLELNTFAHAVCTLLIYLLWWNKPLDIEEPTLIEGVEMYEICAAMCMRSKIGAVRKSSHFSIGHTIYANIWVEGMGAASAVDIGIPAALVWHTKSTPNMDCPIYNDIDIKTVGAPTICPYPQSTLSGTKTQSPETPPQFIRLYMGQSLSGFAFRRVKINMEKATEYTNTKKRFNQPSKMYDLPIHRSGILGVQRPYIDLTHEDILCWRLASQGLQRYPELLEHPKDRDYNESYYYHPGRLHRRYLRKYVVDRAQDWPFWYLDSGSVDENLGASGLFSMLWSFLIAGLVYGALHLVAWNAPFPSRTEAILWRLSGLTLSISGFAVLGTLGIVFGLAEFSEKVAKQPLASWLDTYRKSRFRTVRVVARFVGIVFKLLFVVSVPSGVAACFLYLLARVYLVIECFRGIGYLPEAVFLLPDWSRYFPHFA